VEEATEFGLRGHFNRGAKWDEKGASDWQTFRSICDLATGLLI